MLVIVASPETLWQTKKRLSTWLFFILASKFITHQRVSQRNFSVMRFVQHKSRETKMKTLGKHMKGAVSNTKRARATRRKEMESKTKKRVVGSSCLYLRVPQQVAAS